MIHLPRASPLHAARAAVGSAWCIAIAGVALSFEHPLVLATLLASVLAAAAAASSSVARFTSASATVRAATSCVCMFGTYLTPFSRLVQLTSGSTNSWNCAARRIRTGSGPSSTACS